MSPTRALLKIKIGLMGSKILTYFIEQGLKGSVVGLWSSKYKDSLILCNNPHQPGQHLQGRGPDAPRRVREGQGGLPGALPGRRRKEGGDEVAGAEARPAGEPQVSTVTWG